MDEQDWYDKDLNDFNDPELSDEKEIILPKSKQISIIKRNLYETCYPYDFWYLISMYIPPEDIGRFALICRTTNQIVNSTAFWICLFNKYSKKETKRFNRLLKKEHFSIIRMYTISSIYENYSLFQKRSNKTDAIQKDPHFLQSSRCTRIWHSKRSTPHESYNYYFQFHLDDTEQDLQKIEPLSPIFKKITEYKISQNSCILHLICSNFVPIGPYMGMILSKLTLNMSSDYRYYKLKMWFDSSKLSTQTSSYNNSVIIIDPILCLRIYKWYNLPSNLD